MSTVRVPTGSISDHCYTLSLEAADDTNVVVLRCAADGCETCLALGADDYAAQVDQWFRAHTPCACLVPTARIA